MFSKFLHRLCLFLTLICFSGAVFADEATNTQSISSPGHQNIVTMPEVMLKDILESSFKKENRKLFIEYVSKKMTKAGFSEQTIATLLNSDIQNAKIVPLKESFLGWEVKGGGRTARVIINELSSDTMSMNVNGKNITVNIANVNLLHFYQNLISKNDTAYLSWLIHDANAQAIELAGALVVVTMGVVTIAGLAVETYQAHQFSNNPELCCQILDFVIQDSKAMLDKANRCIVDAQKMLSNDFTVNQLGELQTYKDAHPYFFDSDDAIFLQTITGNVYYNPKAYTASDIAIGSTANLGWFKDKKKLFAENVCQYSSQQCKNRISEEYAKIINYSNIANTRAECLGLFYKKNLLKGELPSSFAEFKKTNGKNIKELNQTIEKLNKAQAIVK